MTPANIQHPIAAMPAQIIATYFDGEIVAADLLNGMVGIYSVDGDDWFTIQIIRPLKGQTLRQVADNAMVA